VPRPLYHRYQDDNNNVEITLFITETFLSLNLLDFDR